MTRPLSYLRRRRGFTLIELLVVIAIMLSLAALGIWIQPGVSARQQAARGGTQLQQALLTAKSRAKRDMMATGIRLAISDPTGNFCENLTFIQRPDDYIGGTVSVAAGSLNTATLSADPGGNVGVLDYLEIGGNGLPHRITGVAGAQLTLFSNFTNPVPATSQFRIMRAPRPLMGEPPVLLPKDVGIDLKTGLSVAYLGGVQSQLGANVDILFAPSGQLTGDFAGYDMVILWVRDELVTNAKQAFPSLIVIYGKTGSIVAHPVSMGADPYEFAKAARSSGM
ncbi:MAG: type II secretion system GspH family protein [Gemmataceae bacterium]|nr:type II secretion system GspH family protein [Gemmataceae bacterium]